MINVGGIVIKSLRPSERETEFASGVYRYSRSRLSAEITKCLSADLSWTVFCLSASHAVQVATGDLAITLTPGDSVQIEGQEASLSATGGACEVLVAGSKARRSPGASVCVTRSADQYRVNKPWGHELWMNLDHPGYCLKEIFIRRGHRTSLQYHHYKEETNVLFGGLAELVYQANSKVAVNAVTQSDLGSVMLEPGCAIHIVPGLLHRLVAMSDLLLYEVSTPHLDDVIRISDDTLRGHGRILSEHAA